MVRRTTRTLIDLFRNPGGRYNLFWAGLTMGLGCSAIGFTAYSGELLPLAFGVVCLIIAYTRISASCR